MLLIFRGLGFLVVLLAAAGAGLGVVVGSQVQLPGPGTGVGLLIGGAAGVVLGWWLNQVRPEAEVARAREGLQQDLWARVRAGQFQVAPGAPAPRSQEEAQHQVDSVVAAYEPQFKKFRNRHTLFWIPMQYASAAVMAAGLLVLVTTVMRIVTG